MTRLLLVCPEPLGHGQPAGVGIRFLEMARVLRDDGHAITMLSPDAGTIDGCRGDYINPPILERETRAHDAAIVQGHVANALFLQGQPLPTVVDLYDPFLIENLHYFGEQGAEVYNHDHLTLTHSLLRGDFFLCASDAQRLFYLGMLLAVGRLNPMLFAHDPRLESLVALAPFGVQPARVPVARELAAPAILYGGIYDWYDPIAAIDAVAIVRRTLPGATLTFTRHPNPDITPQGKLAEALRYASEGGHRFVRFEPWAAYDERASFFERFALALLTFPSSIETELSMRTRIYDYLWCGLPIVTSSAPGTNEILERYRAGAIVARDMPQAFADEILAIVQDRARYDAMVAGARAFVDEHQWSRTLEPLRAFCRAPRFDNTKETFAMKPVLPDRSRSILHRIKRRLRRATTA
ncbi:MAG: glycosyltransferase family 4 protein [Acidobacteria bacterium]|nr:glycosyltransferase family 4 protein [Acidobacteriota bacterium]MBV9476435.1 glycosyltransferase family 4 protein [Acidobacteriota bacterium]